MAFRTPLDYVNKVPRSTHNQSLDVRTTLHPGLLIPIYWDDMDLGESRTLDLSSLVQANPFLAPYMGGFQLRLEVYFDPLRNYYSWIDNNDKLSTEDILALKKHTFTYPIRGTISSTNSIKELVTTNPALVGKMIDTSDEVLPSKVLQDYSSFVVGKNSLASYLGIPQGSYDIGSYLFQPFLTYLNIWRCYHSNNQETVAPYTRGWYNVHQYNYILSEQTSDPGDVFADFAMNSSDTGSQLLDSLFKIFRYLDDGITLSSVGNPNIVTGPGSEDLNKALRVWLSNSFMPFGGLFPVMYKPDMYRNLLSSEVGNLKRFVTIDPDSNAFSIQELRTENAVQRIIDRLDISGGRFSEWSRTLFGVSSRKGIHIPDLLAVRSTFIGAQNIKATATTESSEGSSQLGQLASVIDSRGAFAPLKVRASERGTLMICACLIPTVDYSQGLDHKWQRLNFADDYNPELQQLNWADVQNTIYSALPLKRSLSFVAQVLGSNGWSSEYLGDDILNEGSDTIFALQKDDVHVIGKQVPWIDKMSAVNKLSGEFGNDGIYQYWTAKRRYSVDKISPLGIIHDGHGNFVPSNLYNVSTEVSYSQYVNPSLWQYMFKDQSIFNHNFFLQVGIAQPRNVKPIGYRYMPSLER